MVVHYLQLKLQSGGAENCHGVALTLSRQEKTFSHQEQRKQKESEETEATLLQLRGSEPRVQHARKKKAKQKLHADVRDVFKAK